MSIPLVDPSSVSGDAHVQVILILGGLLVTLVSAFVYIVKGAKSAEVAATQSSAANQAVNNVGAGEHRLYDKISHILALAQTNAKNIEKLVKIQDEFSDLGWQHLPPDLHDAVALTSTVRELQHAHKEQSELLQEIKLMLGDHVKWEMSQKWPPRD